MALTNYMLQVAVLDLLASQYGFGLKLRPMVYVMGALLLFGGEVALSTAWLARFRFGPLEWMWRTVTYAGRQSLPTERHTRKVVCLLISHAFRIALSATLKI